jgi:hypothetical protein
VRAVEAASTGEVLQGLWRFEGVHPEWTEHDGGEEGWEPTVAWWAVAGESGLVLIDPLVFDWPALDRLVEDGGGCPGIVRTCHWHQRSIAEAAARYGAEVWATPGLAGGLVAHEVERADEIALWLPAQAALLFGDAMLRSTTGELQVCPDSWTQPDGGPARLRAVLRDLAQLPVEHVLVSHGPLVLGDGRASLRSALA